MTAHVPMAQAELLKLAALSEAATDTEKQLVKELLWQRETTLKLVRNMATNAAKCDGCGAEIWWCRSGTKKDKRGQPKAFPVTALGLNHFADCPASEAFRKPVEGRS